MSILSTYEITLIEPLTETEFVFVEGLASREGDQVAMNSNGRILLWETDIEIDEVIAVMARAGFAEDIGLIKKITEYEPERSMIEIEFDNESES